MNEDTSPALRNALQSFSLPLLQTSKAVCGIGVAGDNTAFIQSRARTGAAGSGSPFLLQDTSQSPCLGLTRSSGICVGSSDLMSSQRRPFCCSHTGFLLPSLPSHSVVGVLGKLPLLPQTVYRAPSSAPRFCSNTFPKTPFWPAFFKLQLLRLPRLEPPLCWLLHLHFNLLYHL